MSRKIKIYTIIIIFIVVALSALGIFIYRYKKINSAAIGESNTNQNVNYIQEEKIEQENIVNQVEEKVVQEETMQGTETKQEETTNEQKVKEQNTIPVVKKENKSDNKTKTTQETQEKNNTSVAATPKKEETPKVEVTKTLTPDDLEYWCVAGGTHHIAGNGANEHGYYSSWNEANQAFESYTKGWNSVQYKIDTCSCGLYYFWAIQ